MSRAKPKVWFASGWAAESALVLSPQQERRLARAGGVTADPAVHKLALAFCQSLAPLILRRRLLETQPRPSQIRAELEVLSSAATALQRRVSGLSDATADVLPPRVDAEAWMTQLDQLHNDIESALREVRDLPGGRPPEWLRSEILGALMRLFGDLPQVKSADLVKFVRVGCAIVNIPLPKARKKLVRLLPSLSPIRPRD